MNGGAICTIFVAGVQNRVQKLNSKLQNDHFCDGGQRPEAVRYSVPVKTLTLM